MSDQKFAKRPNFLFLITDQQRADWLGCAGHPVVKTPNIDAIAAAGSRYEEFYVASPVCMPNRASLMTGRYPTVHGLRYNGCLLSTRANTFVDVLRAGGWRTASIGKSHLQPFTSDPPRHQNNIETGSIEEAWKSENADYTLEQPEHYQSEDRYNFPSPYYGFDHIDMVTSHGDRAGGHYQQWFKEKASEQQTTWQSLHDPANELPHEYVLKQAYRTPIPEELYPTAYVEKCASSWIAKQANDTAPFFAFVSFPDPHHPFNPPGQYWDMYQPDQFDIPRTFSSHSNPTPPIKYCHEQFNQGIPSPSLQTAFACSDREVKEAMALTAGMITNVDDAIGRLIHTLKQTGQYENTVIVFNSDHGDYMGDYHLLLKGAQSMRGINRVPFIWSDPAARQPHVTSSLSSTLDIAPTIIARAGLKPYFGIQGIDLAPEQQNNQNVRDKLMIEYQDGFARMGFKNATRVRTLLHNGWRLTLYKDETWGELYNLNSDPNESQNLWQQVECQQRKAQLIEMLAQEMISAMDESPRGKRLA